MTLFAVVVRIKVKLDDDDGDSGGSDSDSVPVKVRVNAGKTFVHLHDDVSCEPFWQIHTLKCNPITDHYNTILNPFQVLYVYGFMNFTRTLLNF